MKKNMDRKIAEYWVGAIFPEVTKSGINNPGLFSKMDSFVLISSLSGSNDLDEETCSLIGCYREQAYNSSQ